jgi:hypothetical protein
MEKRKTHTSAEVKDRYNKKTYVQYAFRVRNDDGLYEAIEMYKKAHPQGLSELIKSRLEKHFAEGDEHV